MRNLIGNKKNKNFAIKKLIDLLFTLDNINLIFLNKE